MVPLRGEPLRGNGGPLTITRMLMPRKLMDRGTDSLSWAASLESATGARTLSQTVNERSTLNAAKRAVVCMCADGGQGSVVLLEAG